ncbi:hypothetical protein N5W20_07370 [Candidatus Kirkpatrickella diaphorinae]|uniref:Auto-transporter adhesin head GIN domain-containing protein n=1 Tax=Candidatus Kirkpatrickella diaphorinae TaxID=2984322 RepID=A0ABY6GJB0_9PROT|nr:hypothetical protein [Candidatus Kirkpatrickella diaphorinae]UYH50920.1 hypothetical protein N5W20_07370 [Candidatus Kirkpatrickella diaphorinae]
MPRRRSLVSIPEFRILRAGMVVLLGGLVATYLTWPGRTFAQDSSTWTVEEVDLSLPCFERVAIQVDPKYPRAVAIEGPRHGVTVSSRVVQDQGAARVALTAPACQAGHGYNTMSLRVGGDVGVTLHDSPQTRFVVSGRLASLEANLSDGSVSAVEIASLDISIHGSENVAIGRLERAGQVTANGTARLTVREAALDALSATLSDRASLQIDGGKIVALTLTTQDAASARVNGSLDTAIVTANGSGAISLPLTTAPLVRHGTGSITQSKPEAAPDAVQKPVEVVATKPDQVRSAESKGGDARSEVLIRTTVANDVPNQDDAAAHTAQPLGTTPQAFSGPAPSLDSESPINAPATSAVAPFWNALPTTNTLPAVKAMPGEAMIPQALPDTARPDAKPEQQSDGKTVTVTDNAAHADPGSAPASEAAGPENPATVTGKAEATHGDAPQTSPSSAPVNSATTVEKPSAKAADRKAASARQ